MANQGPTRSRVVDQPGRHQALDLRSQRIGNPPEGLATRPRGPMPAGQRDDRRGHLCRCLLEGVGQRRDRGAVADPHDHPVAHRAAQHLRGEAADHPPGQVLGPLDRRGEVDGIEVVGPPQLVACR